MLSRNIMCMEGLLQCLFKYFSTSVSSTIYEDEELADSPLSYEFFHAIYHLEDRLSIDLATLFQL